jgi:hypothetical protein
MLMLPNGAIPTVRLPENGAATCVPWGKAISAIPLDRRDEKNGLVESGDAPTLGIGAMTDARWKLFFDTMVKAKVCAPDFDYKQAYTLQFVDKKVGM